MRTSCKSSRRLSSQFYTSWLYYLPDATIGLPSELPAATFFADRRLCKQMDARALFVHGALFATQILASGRRAPALALWYPSDVLTVVCLLSWVAGYHVLGKLSMGNFHPVWNCSRSADFNIFVAQVIFICYRMFFGSFGCFLLVSH